MTSSLFNGMSLTEAALRQDDQVAFQALLGPLLKSNVQPTIFVYKDITLVDGTTTTMLVSVSKEKTPVNMWVYHDNVEITYNRLALSSLIDSYGNEVAVDFPTTYEEVFRTYLLSEGLYDRGIDVVPGTVESPSTVTLVAVDHSFMLTGSAEFNVVQLTKYLGDVVKNTTPDIFYLDKGLDGDPVDELLAKVSEDNINTLPRPILSSDVGVRILEITSEYDEVNTRAELYSNGSAVFQDKVEINYHRINFAWLYNGVQIEVSGPAVPNFRSLANQITSITGYPFYLAPSGHSRDNDDLINPQFGPQSRDEPTTLTIFVNPNSLRYVGEITINYTVR